MRNERRMPHMYPRGWQPLNEAGPGQQPAARPPQAGGGAAAGVDMGMVRKVMSTWHRNFGHQVNDPQFVNTLMATVSNPRTGPQALAMWQKNPQGFYAAAWQKAGRNTPLPKPVYQQNDQYQQGKGVRGDEHIDQIQQQTNSLGGMVRRVAEAAPQMKSAQAFAAATDELSKVIFAIKKTQPQQGGGQ